MIADDSRCLFMRKEEQLECKKCGSKNTKNFFMKSGNRQHKHVLQCKDCGKKEVIATLTFTPEE